MLCSSASSTPALATSMIWSCVLPSSMMRTCGVWVMVWEWVHRRGIAGPIGGWAVAHAAAPKHNVLGTPKQ